MPKQSYGPMLRILHYAIDQSINTALEDMELTSAQGHILGYAARQKTPPCPRDIELVFKLSHPTVSGLLSRMEKKGFLQLRTDEKDRRCKRIYILPKGSQCTERIWEKIQQTERQLAEGFSQEEQEQFRTLLERAIANMGGWPECHHKEEETQ